MQGNSLGDKNGLSITRRRYFSLVLGLDQTKGAEKGVLVCLSLKGLREDVRGDCVSE